MRKYSNDEVQKRTSWNGISVDIEWPRGSTREYTDYETGEVVFSKDMTVDYGYIRGTDTSDGEEMDVYVYDDEAEEIYVIDQLVTTEYHKSGAEPGDHDEFKYMLGFNDEEEARNAYILHMTEEHFGGIMALPVDEFREMVKEHG